MTTADRYAQAIRLFEPFVPLQPRVRPATGARETIATVADAIGATLTR